MSDFTKKKKEKAYYPCCPIVLKLLHCSQCIICSSHCAPTSMMRAAAVTDQQMVENRSQQAHNVAA